MGVQVSSCACNLLPWVVLREPSCPCGVWHEARGLCAPHSFQQKPGWVTPCRRSCTDFMDASILCIGLCDVAALISDLFHWAQVAAGLCSCCTALCVCAGFLVSLEQERLSVRDHGVPIDTWVLGAVLAPSLHDASCWASCMLVGTCTWLGWLPWFMQGQHSFFGLLSPMLCMC